MTVQTPQKRFSKNINKPALPGALFAFSILLTIVAWYISNKHLHDKTRDRFEYAAGNIQSAIQVRMAAYEQVLRSAVGLFDAGDTVTRAEWSSYVRTLRLDEHYPGILGMGYSMRMTASDIPSITARIRAEGYTQFRVWPDLPREEYFSIVYLEPMNERNARAFGYDMYTEENRRTAMRRAWETGEPALSRMVILVQETKKDIQKGCLLYLPVYRSKTRLADKESRLASLRGFVYSPFRMNDLMKGILGAAPAGVAFEIYDGRNTDSSQLFYSSHTNHTADKDARLSLSRHLQVAGQEWTLVFRSQPGFTSAIEASQPNIIAVAGIIVNLLLLWIMFKINSLSRRNRELAERYKAEKDRYEIVAQSTNDIIWEWDRTRQTVSTNANFSLVLGYEEASPLLFTTWISYVHADDRERVLQSLHQLMTRGGQDWQEEYRMVKADGTVIHVLDRGRLIADENGAPVKLVGSMINITERKEAEEAQARFSEQLERTVKERTNELQRSNEDLERFAHVASHDLKEPVRKIMLSIDMIRLQYRDKLGEGVRHFDMLSKSAARLNDMIESILDYSTVRYEAQEAEQVDLNKVLQQVKEDLEIVIKEKQATVELPELPVIEGSEVLLHQLFYNLLNNSLKFAQGGVPPQITITACIEKKNGIDRAIIRWQDNGIGFEPQEADKIFQSFVRLHPKEKFEGTGLGLALCKRIVERHHGSIKAIGKPGEGALFVLELPVKQAGGVI